MSEQNNIVVFDADSVVDDASITRIDRSGIIEPGHHWQCRTGVNGVSSVRESLAFEFREGLVYLLTRLVFFDGKLHSVELLNDPSVNTGLGILTVPLLVENFEPLSEEAAVAFRQLQMQAVQAEAAEVQKEMTEATMNPALLEPVIREGVEKWEREQARANRTTSEDDDEQPTRRAQVPAIATNGQFNLTGAVNNRITSTDIAVFRHMAQREGVIAEIRGKWLTEKVEHLGNVLKQLTPFYSEQAAIGKARAHEALGLARDVEKGLRSLRLYTGDGVTVEQLAEGASAPASEPLTLYQRKLYMDEEFAVWDSVDRMFDACSSNVFFQALREHEGLRQQLIPAPRGVVGMAVRRSDVNYDAKTIEQALAAQEMNRINKALFLLVRDGDNWYQVFSAEPSHEVSPRLFPTRNEMDSIFNGFDGEKIGFEDLRFTHRTTEYDRKALAYKRFLILACGLDHSRKLFGQFYPEREALSFISQGFQSKYMRFVADDDGDVMLGDNVDDVHELINQNQSQLAAGCRVLVFCSQALSEREAAPGAYNNGTYSRRDSETVYRRMVNPVHKAIFATVRRDKDELVVNVPVERINDYTSSGWGRSEPIVRKYFSVKVALSKLRGGSISYLITDTLKAEELRPYIYSRRQRANHWDYLYGFKLAMQMMGAEEEANAPLMEHLETEAQNKFGLTRAAAAIAATSAAQSWRLKNPDAETLPALESSTYPELDFQLAEASYAFTHAIPLIDKHITALGGKLVRVMRGKKGQLVAYYEQPEAEKDARIKPWRWLGRRTYTAAGKPTKDAPQTVWMIDGRITGEAELFSVPTELAHRQANDKLLPRLLSNADKVDAMASILVAAFKGEREGVSDEAWAHLTAENEEEKKRHWHRDTVPFERDKRIFLPVAMDPSSGEVVGIAAALYDLLYHYASDAQRGALLEQGYTLPKPKKDHSGTAVPYEGPALALYVDGYVYPSHYTGPVGTAVHISPFRDYATGQYGYKGENRLDHALNFMLAHVPQDAKRSKEPSHWDHTKYLDGRVLWVPPALRADDGSAAISRYFPGLATA
jgi:hypothetical protein